MVTNNFKALDTVVIKDDFYSNPDDIRQLAIGKCQPEYSIYGCAGTGQPGRRHLRIQDQ